MKAPRIETPLLPGRLVHTTLTGSSTSLYQSLGHPLVLSPKRRSNIEPLPRGPVKGKVCNVR